MAEQISFNDFKKLDLRVARITEASAHPNADKLVVMKVDIGGGETRQIVAGIRQHYEAESLVGRSIVMVVNLAPAVLRGVESQGMLLAATHEKDVVLVTPDREAPPGSAVN
ncbi:MAG: methionine--tRNA ligase subunit beta [Planctomycetota bacterium]|jgi:methionyl-tRNA synthetase